VGKWTPRYWAGALVLWLAAVVASCGPDAARAPAPDANQPPLIARADLFGDPVRHGGQLSPRGDRVAFLAPRDGVQNLWVLSVEAMEEARPVTDDRVRGIRHFYWAEDNATLLYLQDEQGDENWRLYAIDIGRGLPRALTPGGVRAEVLGLSPNDPTGVIVAMNQRDREWPDVFRVDIQSGERTLLQRNLPAQGFSRFIVDRENRVRLGVRPLADGGYDIASRNARGRWSTLLTVPFEDAMSTRVIAFETDGRAFLMLDSTGRENAALVRVDAESGVKTPLGENERADVVDVWLDPATHAPEAFATEYLRREWRALDPETQADLDFLDRQLSGDFTVTSRSADNARWIVVEEGPALASRSHLYDRADRAGRRLSSLFRHRPGLDNAPLQPMTPVEIQARDGETLVSYLTLPIGADANGDARPEAPVPMVIVPHGGPWERDSYGFDPMHQWLANRGYAVLSVNFRGSAGLGKSLLNAANREWGGRIREDLVDAKNWAAANGVAQPDRVAIVGAGFGGYAALSSLAFSASEYRCGASYNAPGNLFAWLDTSPLSARAELYQRIGDARLPAGRDILRQQSPLFHAAQIRAPLLLGVGVRQGRGLRGEADQIAQTLRARRGALTYLVFPDEGRELVRPANRLSYLAVLEHFLGDCLGGRVEPVGASFEGASIQVYDGAMNVPGLSAFARRPAALQVEEPPPAQSPDDGAGGPEDEAKPPEDVDAVPL